MEKVAERQLGHASGYGAGGLTRKWGQASGDGKGGRTRQRALKARSSKNREAVSATRSLFNPFGDSYVPSHGERSELLAERSEASYYY